MRSGLSGKPAQPQTHRQGDTEQSLAAALCDSSNTLSDTIFPIPPEPTFYDYTQTQLPWPRKHAPTYTHARQRLLFVSLASPCPIQHLPCSTLDKALATASIYPSQPTNALYPAFPYRAPHTRTPYARGFRSPFSHVKGAEAQKRLLFSHVFLAPSNHFSASVSPA